MNILENILPQEVVQKLGWTLLHFVWQGVVVALLLAILLRVLRKSSASLRYAVACLGLVIIVLLPVVTFYIVPVVTPTSDLESVPTSPVMETAQPREVYDADMPLQRAAKYMQIFPEISWQQRAKNLYASALPSVVLGWLIGVLGLSLWHLGGWAQLQRLKRKSINHVDASLKDKLHKLTERLKVTRPVKLMESALVQIPTVVGWLRPVVLLPASALTGLTAEQLEAVLAHELAHIRRYDYPVNMLQTVVEIVGFYHPGVWWISHKMRVERENCCDDLAVSVCGDKVSYARALTSMEEIRLSQSELVIAAGGGNLFRRISRLVGNNSAEKSPRGRAPAVIATLLIMALAIPTTLALTATDSGKDLRADSVTTYAKDFVFEKKTDSSVTTHSESYLTETDTKAQIQFDCKIYEVPSDLKIVKGKQAGNLIIDIGGEYAERLESLCRKTKKAKMLAYPRILVFEGEEASMVIGNEIPYKAGYELTIGIDNKPAPIVKTSFDGIELKLKVHTVDGSTIRTELRLTQSKIGLTTHKDNQGREIQIPVGASSVCTTDVTVPSRVPVVIGGLKSQNNDNNQLLLVITPFIMRPEKTIEKRIHIVREGPAIENEYVRIVKDFVTAVTKDRHINSLKTVKKQMDESREMLDGQVYSIRDCGVEDDKAMVIYKLEKEEDGKEVRWQVVFKLVKESGKWLIDDIDFASLGDVQKERTTAGKPAGKEADSARELEALQQAQEYMKALHLQSPKSEQSHMLEQLKVLRALEKSQQDAHESLTRHAAYCAERGDFAKAAEYQEMAIELAKSQKYYGIGIAINKTDGLIRVDAILPNTPASGSSFQRGDIIEAVDGVSTEGMSLDDVVARIVGPKGTEVTLSVKSRSQDITEKKTFTRQLQLEGSHVLRAYEWRLAAYKSGKTWPQYRRMMEEQTAQKTGAPRIFEIKYASAEELAEVLNRILERRWKGMKDRSTEAVRIIPEPNRNRLIVIASPEDIQLIEALIAELDIIAKHKTVVLKADPFTKAKQDSPAEDTHTEIIKLKYADCESLAEKLTVLFAGEPLRIVPHKHTNTLLVAGTESAIKKMKDVVAAIDVRGSNEELGILY